MSAALIQYALLGVWALILAALASAACKREIRRVARLESELGKLLSPAPEKGG